VLVAELRQRLSYKRTTGMFDIKLFILKNVNEVEDKEQYSFTMSGRFAAEENSNDVDISRT
jgi:hypothetical protein